jgi:hypothetical protein
MPKQLNIRSDEAHEAATRLAQRLGTTTTDAVLRALRKLEQDTYRPLKRDEFTPEQESTYAHFKALALKARREAGPAAPAASAAPTTPAPAASPLARVALARAIGASLAPAPPVPPSSVAASRETALPETGSREIASPATAPPATSEERIILALGGKK